MYADANYLYAWVMSKRLLTGCLSKITPEKITAFNETLTIEDDQGYVFDARFEPRKLPTRSRNYPVEKNDETSVKP